MQQKRGNRAVYCLVVGLQVCKAAQAALTADRKEQRLQETAQRRRAGDKLAVPNPIDLVIRL
jgi:hypothetical protein